MLINIEEQRKEWVVICSWLIIEKERARKMHWSHANFSKQIFLAVSWPELYCGKIGFFYNPKYLDRIGLLSFFTIGRGCMVFCFFFGKVSKQENRKFRNWIKFVKVVSLNKFEEWWKERVALLFMPSFERDREKCRCEKIFAKQANFLLSFETSIFSKILFQTKVSFKVVNSRPHLLSRIL